MDDRRRSEAGDPMEDAGAGKAFAAQHQQNRFIEGLTVMGVIFSDDDAQQLPVLEFFHGGSSFHWVSAAEASIQRSQFALATALLTRPLTG